MTSNVSLFFGLLLTALVMPMASTTASAQETDLLRAARNSALIAGGARYCKFDPDEIEAFISRAEAQLSVMARDDYEKVLARLEFKNLLDAFSVKEPEGGCDSFQSLFDQASRNIR